MKLSDVLGFGLACWLASKTRAQPQPVHKKRKFLCWLCKSETEFRDVPPGTYQAKCSYCDLPCTIKVDVDSPVIQATIGEIKLESL